MLGGGYDTDKLNRVIDPQEFECFDEYNWNDISNIANCSSFLDQYNEPDIEQCLSLGHLVSGDSLDASDSCCDCHYGYNEIGGGYRGILRGKVLRVKGAIPSFTAPIQEILSGLRSFSESHGLAILQLGDNNTGIDDCSQGKDYSFTNVKSCRSETIIYHIFIQSWS